MIAPSQAKQPLAPPPQPEYPFHLTVTDFFDLHGKNYLVYADRYTGCVEIALLSNNRFSTVSDTLRNWFITYGAPEELSTDGGPPFQSTEYATFLRNWGIARRLSSAYYAQSNGRAELAVKSAKRILSDNVDGSGRLNHDKVARALLIHRNTPVVDVNMSPAFMLYGRPIRDHLPALRETNRIRPEWTEIRDLREAALAKRHMRNEQWYNEHTRNLSELVIGDSVQVQNQNGSYPRRWHTTGRVVEDLGHRQYRVRIDGSNRVTLRNRRFLKKILPITDVPYLDSNDIPQHVQEQISPVKTVEPDVPIARSEPATPVSPIVPIASVLPATPVIPSTTVVPATPVGPTAPVVSATPVLPVVPATPVAPAPVLPEQVAPAPRRSTRARKPRRALSPQMRGKTHGYSFEQ